MASGFHAGIPGGAYPVKTFFHDEMVSAVTISNPVKHVYAGGKGHVKFWDLTERGETQLRCPGMERNAYIHSVKLLPDMQTLIAAGQSSRVYIYDLVTPIGGKFELQLSNPECHALATSPDSRLCYCCCGDGKIEVWDLHNQTRVWRLEGHPGGGASCIDISPDGTKCWTGGFDRTVTAWDCRQFQPLFRDHFDSEILSLGLRPTAPGEWLAFAMKNSQIGFYDLLSRDIPVPPHYKLRQHSSAATSLKFAPSGNWLVSTGKDNRFFVHRMPDGLSRFMCDEAAPIMCCDVSADEKYIVTGSGDRTVTVYRIRYFDKEKPYKRVRNDAVEFYAEFSLD